MGERAPRAQQQPGADVLGPRTGQPRDDAVEVEAPARAHADGIDPRCARRRGAARSRWRCGRRSGRPPRARRASVRARACPRRRRRRRAGARATRRPRRRPRTASPSRRHPVRPPAWPSSTQTSSGRAAPAPRSPSRRIARRRPSPPSTRTTTRDRRAAGRPRRSTGGRPAGSRASRSGRPRRRITRTCTGVAAVIADRARIELTRPQLRGHRRLPVRREVDVVLVAVARTSARGCARARVPAGDDRRHQVAAAPPARGHVADRGRGVGREAHVVLARHRHSEHGVQIAVAEEVAASTRGTVTAVDGRS